MDAHPADHPLSVSAIAVIDLSDSHAGDPHGSVVVIGGEADSGAGSSGSGSGSGGSLDGVHGIGALLDSGGATADHTGDEEEEEDEDEDDDDDDGCGPECGHDHASAHLHATAHAYAAGSGSGVGNGMIPSGRSSSGGAHSPTPSSASTATTPGGSGPGKRKRVVLSIHEKQQVLQRLEMGEQPVIIARDFGISRQQVSDIKKNRDRIVAFCIDAKHLSSLRRKTLKATTEYHPGVEQELYRWLIRQRRLGRSVTSDALSHKTADLFMQYSADDAASVSFRAISTWLRHFKRAHGIKLMTEDEITKLPSQFTPAMDMARSSSGSTTGSVGAASPTASALSASMLLAPGGHAASGLGTTMEDVSAFMNATVGSGATTTTTSSTLQHTFMLQNQAPTDSSSTHGPSQMLMLSSASTGTATSSSAATSSLPGQPALPGSSTNTMPISALASPGSGTLASIQSSLQIVQELASQMSFFEREVTLKLDHLGERVDKLCFNAMPPTRFT